MKISLVLPQFSIFGWPPIVPLGAAETSPRENRNKMTVFITVAITFQTDKDRFLKPAFICCRLLELIIYYILSNM